jgi:hypothetical protein
MEILGISKLTIGKDSRRKRQQELVVETNGINDQRPIK